MSIAEFGEALKAGDLAEVVLLGPAAVVDDAVQEDTKKALSARSGSAILKHPSDSFYLVVKEYEDVDSKDPPMGLPWIEANIGYYLVSDDLNSNASFESGSDGDVAGIEIASSSHGERADVLFDSGSDWADSADELDSGSERSTSSNELSRGRTADLKANLMDAEFRLLSAQIPKEIRLSSADRARLADEDDVPPLAEELLVPEDIAVAGGGEDYPRPDDVIDDNDDPLLCTNCVLSLTQVNSSGRLVFTAIGLWVGLALIPKYIAAVI
ncbi:hypothetical protein PInf_026098 [Phytophthora infestans]|nr:hypothetical protein PInf_026098 [Phytophthora infestans]